jgi:hypothetical protein
MTLRRVCRCLIVFLLTLTLVRAWTVPGLDSFHLPTSADGLPDGLPGIPGMPSLDWQTGLQALWESHKDRFSYCVGDNLEDAWQLLQQSFPMPLLTDPTDTSGVCSNTTAIYTHLCGPQEVAIYLKVGANRTGVCRALLHSSRAACSKSRSGCSTSCNILQHQKQTYVLRTARTG